MQDKKVRNNILINRLSSLNKKVPVQDVNILFWRYKIRYKVMFFNKSWICVIPF